MTDHDKRVYHHMYETNEGIWEHAERIAKLEELVRDMWPLTGPMPTAGCDSARATISARMRELGVEVDG